MADLSLKLSHLYVNRLFIMKLYVSYHLLPQFVDGYSYSKGKMEEAFRSELFNKPATKPVKEVHNMKKEDVNLIVRELLMFYMSLLSLPLDFLGDRAGNTLCRS